MLDCYCNIISSAWWLISLLRSGSVPCRDNCHPLQTSWFLMKCSVTSHLPSLFTALSTFITVISSRGMGTSFRWYCYLCLPEFKICFFVSRSVSLPVYYSIFSLDFGIFSLKHPVFSVLTDLSVLTNLLISSILQEIRSLQIKSKVLHTCHFVAELRPPEGPQSGVPYPY